MSFNQLPRSDRGRGAPTHKLKNRVRFGVHQPAKGRHLAVFAIASDIIKTFGWAQNTPMTVLLGDKEHHGYVMIRQAAIGESHTCSLRYNGNSKSASSVVQTGRLPVIGKPTGRQDVEFAVDTPRNALFVKLPEELLTPEYIEEGNRYRAANAQDKEALQPVPHTQTQTQTTAFPSL